ncbi:flagellar export chaperone FliS [Paenibacillus popilliae]|nr:flagellar export chaperone FliS [Paenibacillus sp. SDF0028]
MQQAMNRYYQTQIMTATPEELTLMLYNGCIRFLKQTEASMNNKNFSEKSTFISKALDILDELQVTLDMKYEISSQLSSLYEYFKERLTYASIHMNTDVLREVITMMEELRDTWQEAIKLVKQ